MKQSVAFRIKAAVGQSTPVTANGRIRPITPGVVGPLALGALSIADSMVKLSR
jgi:hypothetical protein